MKKRIISLNISEISYSGALDKIISLSKSKTPSYFCFANAHMTVLGREDEAFRMVVNNSTDTFSDGVPVAKAFSILYKKKQVRIAGMDAFPDLLSMCNEEGLNVFLFGDTDETLAKIKQRVSNEISPNLICGAISPPFGTNLNDSAYIEKMTSTKADIVFVALGCPKQEKWMYENTKHINAPLLGVGGAFPVYAQTQKRCPNWMAKFGLEWLYRLIQEPKRLFKRYVETNSKFVYYLLRAKLTKSDS